MTEIWDHATLLRAIENTARTAARITAIEGHSASGKTTLARRLASLCGGQRLSTDEYVVQSRDAETYYKYLDLKRLTSDLAVTATLQAPLFIEGICLRDTLLGLNLTPTTFVYCKRVTPAGLWADDLDNYVENGRPKDGLSWVDRQSVEYHIRQSPVQLADFVFAWKE